VGPGELVITDSLRSVTYGKGQFVTVGDKGTILISSDGTNWTKTISGTSNDFKSVAYGNDQFIAVESRFTDACVNSRDGTNWTTLKLVLPPYTRFPYTIGYGAGQFILLWNALILTSTNGTNWTDTFSANGASAYSDVAFGNGRFVAVGSEADIGGGGNVATSTDAITWSPVHVGTDHLLYSIAFGDGRFVTVGGADGMVGGLILSSSDGADWTPHPPGTPGWLEDIAYGNARFVAIGDFNTILATQPIIRLEPALANGSPQFKISGPPGQSCRIQASTDFANWVTLTNCLVTDGGGQFIDLSATNFSHRFYQAVSP